MLLAVDIGNTNIVMGLFNGDRLLKSWRLSTFIGRTADELEVLLSQMWSAAGYNSRDIRGVAVACVVPPVLDRVIKCIENVCSVKPLIVGPGIKTGIKILLDNPRELGADRIVNAIAAYERYKSGVIVVDFGTATTFDCVSPDFEYLGGAIAPGIDISLKALVKSTAQLPNVDITRPASVLGKSTVQGIKSGIYYGYTGLVDGLVEKLKAELKFHCHVLGTGGMARIIATESSQIEDYDELLTLTGLRLLFERNC